MGATKGDIAGTLYWVPKPGGGAPMGAIVALLALVVVGGAAVVVVRRRRQGDVEAERGPEAGAEAW